MLTSEQYRPGRTYNESVPPRSQRAARKVAPRHRAAGWQVLCPKGCPHPPHPPNLTASPRKSGFTATHSFPSSPSRSTGTRRAWRAGLPQEVAAGERPNLGRKSQKKQKKKRLSGGEEGTSNSHLISVPASHLGSFIWSFHMQKYNTAQIAWIGQRQLSSQN